MRKPQLDETPSALDECEQEEVLAYPGADDTEATDEDRVPGVELFFNR